MDASVSLPGCLHSVVTVWKCLSVEKQSRDQESVRKASLMTSPANHASDMNYRLPVYRDVAKRAREDCS